MAPVKKTDNTTFEQDVELTHRLLVAVWTGTTTSENFLAKTVHVYSVPCGHWFLDTHQTETQAHMREDKYKSVHGSYPHQFPEGPKRKSTGEYVSILLVWLYKKNELLLYAARIILKNTHIWVKEDRHKIIHVFVYIKVKERQN